MIKKNDMFVWPSAFIITIGFHSFILFFFVFTWPGVSKNYQVEFVSLGPILRSYDVAIGRTPESAGVESQSIDLLSASSAGERVWINDIQTEKPALIGNMDLSFDERLLKFSGEKVYLDEEVTPRDLGNDIPPAPNIDFRIGSP